MYKRHKQITKQLKKMFEQSNVQIYAPTIEI